MSKLLAFGFIAIFITSCVPAKQFNDLKAAQEKCENERQDLTSKNRTVAAENDQLKADLESLTKKHNQLKEDTATLGKSSRKIRAKQIELDALNQELMQKLKSSKQEGSEENRKLVDILRATQDDLLKREDRLRDLEKQMSAKEKRLSDLEVELKDREARVKELEDIIAEKDAAVRALKDRIAQALLGFKDKGLTVEQRDGKIYVSLEAQLLFASGSTAVNSEGKKALLDLSQVIKDEQDITILVEGHTDTDPFNGGGAVKDNWDLSVMRATSVVKIMTAEGNVNANRLTAAGRGEFMPISPNTNSEGKAKNRRIEIILTPNLDQLFKIINE
jgi:chemotaxis protein MotB